MHIADLHIHSPKGLEELFAPLLAFFCKTLTYKVFFHEFETKEPVVIYDDRSRLWEYMDKNVVRSLVDEHLNGTANRRLLIWGLLNFNQLLKTWF